MEKENTAKWILLCICMFCIRLALPAKIIADKNACLTKLLPGGYYDIPESVPTGANICNRTCYDQSECTYSFVETLQAYPPLLFRCQCLGGCPPKKMLFADHVMITCTNVSNEQSRCTCPDSQKSFHCSFDFIENVRHRPFYCACCEPQDDGLKIT